MKKLLISEKVNSFFFNDKMNDFIAKYAFNPLLPISKPEIDQIADIELKDTYATLFTAYPKEEYFENLHDSLPLLNNMASEPITVKDNPNIHSGNISLWQTYLNDPSISLYSIRQIPNFSSLKIKELIEYCIENKIAPERAAFAIQLYCHSRSVTSDKLTNILISNTEFYENKIEYFMLFTYELYSHNLLQHFTFLHWILRKFKPCNITIYKEEIIRTHSLLFSAFQNDNSYIKEFTNDLLINKSQLVQLAIISHLQEIPFQKHLHRLLNPQMKKRAKQLISLASITLTFTFSFRNYLFLNFPYINIGKFCNQIRKLVYLSTDEELISNILSICKTLLFFDDNLPSLSAIVTYLIQNLLNEQSSLNFPLSKFIDLLYIHSNKIDKFRFLFNELQNFGILDYNKFLDELNIKGLFEREKETTLKILLNLPTFNSERKVRQRFESIMKRLYPDNSFREYVMKIQSNIFENTELLSKLPAIFRYNFGLYVIDKFDPEDFTKITSFLIAIDCVDLIITHFEKSYERDPQKVEWEFKTIRIVQSLLPYFFIRNDFDKLYATICNQPQHPSNLALALFISQTSHYREKQLKSLIDSQKSLFSPELIQDIFYNYSYLCSLQVYDFFMSVKTFRDFDNLFPSFIQDLLSFPCCTLDHLYSFFSYFSESACMSNPSDYFNRHLIFAFIQSNVFYQDKRVWNLIQSFYEKALVSKYFQVSFFFESFFEVCRRIRVRNDMLTPPSAFEFMKIFISILENHKSDFTVESIFTYPIINGLQRIFPGENTPLIDLLSILRTLKPPIITAETMDKIEDHRDKYQSFAAAFFSLIPYQLQARNFLDVFYYFKDHVTRETATFWSLWLKYKSFYIPGFPVLPVKEVIQEELGSYHKQLISSFSALLFQASSTGHSHIHLYLNCWMVICRHHQAISQQIVTDTIYQLQTLKFPFLGPIMLNFLHPTLMVINQETFQELCSTLCKYKYDTAQFDQFVNMAASVFCVYASRFPLTTFVSIMANKVLEWIPTIKTMNGKNLSFVIDIFNFLVCFSSENARNKDEKEVNAFREQFFNIIQPNVVSLPNDIAQCIILDVPPQSIKPPQRHFYENFGNQEEMNFPSRIFHNGPQLRTGAFNKNSQPTLSETTAHKFELSFDDDYKWFNDE